MKNLILIISIITIIVVFIVIYLSDYIKEIYFYNSIEDFRDAYDIIAGLSNRNRTSQENFENKVNEKDKDELIAKYEERLKLRRDGKFNDPASPTNLEVSFNAETDLYKNGVYDRYSTINDPVSDAYLPYTIKNYKDDPSAISTNNMNEFTIINIYKNTLDRQPTDKELSKNLQDFYENEMNEDVLKLRIYNSTEFKIITNMQSNDIKPELITNISKGQLKDKLKKLYQDQHNTELINTKLLDILTKCYIHLQFNDYLFKAMLMHDNYNSFENRLRNVYILTDEKLLEIFNESFILHELRLIANELKRQDIIKRKALTIPVSLYKDDKSELNSSNVNIGAAKNISDIVKNSDNVFNINIMVNDKLTEANKNMSTPYSRTTPNDPPIYQLYQPNNERTPLNQIYGGEQSSPVQTLGSGASGITGASGIIGAIANIAGSTNIGNNSPNIPNNLNIANSANNSSNLSTIFNNATNNALNNAVGLANTANIANTIMRPPGTPGTSGTSGTLGTLGILGIATRIPGTASSSNYYYDPKYKDIYDNLQNDLNSQSSESSQSSQSSQQDNMMATPRRIYDPIDYKQHYRGDMRNRPNVCSYGTKQIVQPIFLNSSTLFQGTDLKEAAENTQVGSIMPKFEYREYEDTK